MKKTKFNFAQLKAFEDSNSNASISLDLIRQMVGNVINSINSTEGYRISKSTLLSLKILEVEEEEEKEEKKVQQLNS